MTIINNLKETISRILSGDEIKSEDNPFLTWAPLGHFYSPIPDLNEIKAKEDMEFKVLGVIKGIDLKSET